MKGKMCETQSSGHVSTRLHRIAEVSRERCGEALTALAHHIDLEWLREAYRRTRKDGAPGVDGAAGQEYGTNLDANLQDLLDRFKSGRYHAPPVRRTEIPKGDGRLRPIGIPTFEDKVLQRAVAMVLESVYEQDFLDCSYGFRPGRSAHQAIEALWQTAMREGGGWVIDLDIESFFDSLDHSELRAILDQRVRDGVIRRQIDKWLNAGIFNSGRLERSERGTPQGGVVSPLLANVYLHEVLDTWFERDVKPRLRGPCQLIRYADDAVILLREREDAERVLKVLPQRLARYGLKLHSEKTRLVRFEQPHRKQRPNRDERPGTFDFLGFTHFWGLSRNRYWVVKRKTMGSRLRRTLRNISQWCRRNLHRPVADQQKYLNQVIVGHCRYFGITGNSAALGQFHHWLRRIWLKWLRRRSQRRTLSWEAFERLLQRYPLQPVRSYQSVLRRAYDT